MRVLDAYGDDYRASQLTIVLEVSVASGRGGGGSGGWAPGQSLHLLPLLPTRMRAARAQMPPLLAMLKMSLQRKRVCPRPEGHLHPQNPAARPPVRGPADARGGERPGTDAEREPC